MSRRLVLPMILMFVLLGMLASVILFLFSLRVNAQPEEWVPYIPDASQIVELDYWEENGTSYMDISIEFLSTGYNVSDWGTPTIVGNNISVNTEIWDWTGLDNPVMIMKSHTYSLGNLSATEYFFIFKAWSFSIKKTTFIVPEFPSLIILLLFMITTPIAITVYRRKHTSLLE